MFIGEHMNKIIPITEKQFIRFRNTFYEFYDVSFVEIDSTGIFWFLGDDCFDNNCKFYLDTPLYNNIIHFKHNSNDLSDVIKKILK